MIVVVKKKKPPRYACKRCKCEVGSGPEPEKHLSAVDSATNGVRIRDWDEENPEDLIAFDRNCECRCHDVWRIVFGQSTPRLEKMRAKWDARPPEPVKPLPRDDEPDEGDDLW